MRNIQSVVAESTFNILRLSFIVGIFILVWSSKLKSQTLGRSDHWFPRNSTSFQAFYLVRSPGLKFKIWGRSLYFEVCFRLWCLHLKHLWFWFGPLSISLKFVEDLIIGCWDIQHLIFWECLPLEVVIHWRSSSFQAFFIYFGPLS